MWYHKNLWSSNARSWSHFTVSWSHTITSFFYQILIGHIHRQNERRCITIGLIFFKTWSQKPIVGHVWSQNVKTSIRTEMVEARLWSNEALVGQTDTKHFNLPSPFLMAGGSLTSPCSCHEGLRNHSYEILLHDCRIM